MNTIRSITVSEELALAHAVPSSVDDAEHWLEFYAFPVFFNAVMYDDMRTEWDLRREIDDTLEAVKGYESGFAPELRRYVERFEAHVDMRCEAAEAYAAMKRAEKYGW